LLVLITAVWDCRCHSREAATEYSPRRKPWVKFEGRPSPGWAKENMHNRGNPD
jgi:hypothetical protein